MALAFTVVDTAGVSHTLTLASVFRVVPATPADRASRGVQQYIYLQNGTTINAVTPYGGDAFEPIGGITSVGVSGTITGLGYVQLT